MQFHGIGNGSGEHGAQAHQVTKCMHDHSHYKMEGDVSKAGASAARSQSMEAPGQQNEGQFSLSAWLDNYLSRGKSLLRGFWSGGGTQAPGAAGSQSGQEQVLAQINESREAAEAGPAGPVQSVPAASAHQPDPSQAVHVSRAAQAAAPALQAGGQAAAQAGENDGREGMWRKIKVRFKDIAGHLTGHLRGNTSRFQAKRPFQPKQAVVREEPEKTARPRRDAVEIDKYHVEESYLLDSYDRKGGYSKLSTKK